MPILMVSLIPRCNLAQIIRFTPYVKYAYLKLRALLNFTLKFHLEGGDIMIIDFNEEKFKNEVRSIAKNFGASSSDSKKVASMAVSIVLKSSRPINQ